MKKITLRGTIFLFVSILTISCIIMPVNGASPWIIQTVDTEGLIGLGSSIAIDNFGLPWISYSDGTSNPEYHLKVAHFTGTSWETSTVDPAGDTVTAIAIDGTGAPVIAYQDSITPALKYAKLVGPTWEIETVDTECQYSNGISLVIDPTGKPHIAYIDRTDLDRSLLKYVVKSDSKWSSPEVVTDKCEGSDTSMPSLQLNSEGTPYISYCIKLSGELVYAKRDGSTWSQNTIAVGTPYYSSFKLNNAGNPCACYMDTDILYYKYFEGGGWHTQIVDSNVDYYTALIIDVAGYPHIGYYDKPNQDLRYAYYDGTAWQKETVDAKDDVGTYVSLTLDNAGYPYISYMDMTSYDLKCAYIRIPLMPTPESDGVLVLLFSVAIAVGCFVGIKRKTK